MKRLIISAIFVLAAFAVYGQSALSKLESMEGNSQQAEQDVKVAATTSATRLFSEMYDLTAVIMLIPKDSIIYVFSEVEDYLFVEYQGVQGYIFNRDVEYFKPDIQIEEQPAPVQQATQNNPPAGQQNVQQQYNEPQRKSLNELQRKYGSNVGIKVYSGKIWRGMTTEMVFDSWGSPLRINEVQKRGMVMQEWIFNNTWLYFENDILMEWGPTRRR